MMVAKRASDVDAHVGGRVRERRREIGMSQGKLGRAVGTENPIRGNDRVADPNRVTIPPYVRGRDIGAVGFPNAVQVASPS